MLDAAVPPELQEVIAQEEFASYYSSDAAENFASRVTFNNIQVAFLAFALGVVPLIGPVPVAGSSPSDAAAAVAKAYADANLIPNARVTIDRAATEQPDVAPPPADREQGN